jgi:heme oxygenase (biliverdin-IX-beta and delta-forming)
MFLQQLKNDTAESHIALEKNPYSVALMHANVTIEDYLTYLQKLYGFVYGFEKTVFPLLIALDSDIERRRKAALMAQDIISMGGDVTQLQVMSDAVFEEHYTTEIAALGGLYVLEGSMLGGNIIKKHLQDKLSEDVADKTHYFTAYGTELGKVWKDFLNLLTHNASDTDKEGAIIKSAKTTFQLIDKWLIS